MKKFTAVLLVVMLLTTLFVATAGAAPAKKKTDKAVTSIVNGANALIDLTVKIAQVTPKDDGAAAKKATDIIATTTKVVVYMLGGKVECTMTPTKIDGKEYSIDPMMVINPRP